MSEAPLDECGAGSANDRASWVELAIGQGRTQDLEALRQQVADDPMAAIDFSEVRDVIERMRALTVQPSEAWTKRVVALQARATERYQARRPAPILPWLLASAAAAVIFALLSAADPLQLRQRNPLSHTPPPIPRVPEVVPAPYRPEAMTSTMALAFDATKRMEPDSLLSAAWQRYQEAGVEQRLSEWLSPRNAIAVLRIDHELRVTADQRRAVLRDRGLFDAVEDRVQQLADIISVALLASDDADPYALALCLRALVAAGGDRRDVVATATRRLEASLPRLEGGLLAMALCALGEVAATTAAARLDLLAAHGSRWVESVLDVSDEVWSRRRPRMLQAVEPAANLAAAGRFLRFAPAFGIDGSQAMVVRLLLLAQLHERRSFRNETPEVPTALVYGFEDLIDGSERDELERLLRRWRPDGLVPDYLALQQLAATRQPQHLGYARWQLELRRVCAVRTPDLLADQAALCLCLASSFDAEQRAHSIARL